MKKTDFSKIIKFSVIIVLIAAMALCIISCDGKYEQPQTGGTADSQTVGTGGVDTTGEVILGATEENPKYTITVEVINDKGELSSFTVKTNADNLGDALLEAKIVEGEKGPYGLYIKYANGVRADYELDGAYWSLSKNGEMLMTGASDTPIADGEKYELTYTKG